MAIPKRHITIIGATGVIGTSISLALAELGHEFCLHGGHDQEKLDKLKSQVLARGAYACTSFIEAIDDPRVFLDSPKLPWKTDMLFICYGPWSRGSIAETSKEMWHRLVSDNLILPGMLVSTYAPRMAEGGFGRIVMFGGATSDRIQSYKTIAPWAAAKTALGVLAKSAAREFGRNNVTCNVLCPGYHGPREEGRVMTDNSGYLISGGQSTETLEKIAIFLSEDVSNAMNGAILNCGFGL